MVYFIDISVASINQGVEIGSSSLLSSSISWLLFLPPIFSLLSIFRPPIYAFLVELTPFVLTLFESTRFEFILFDLTGSIFIGPFESKLSYLISLHLIGPSDLTSFLGSTSLLYSIDLLDLTHLFYFTNSLDLNCLFFCRI